MVYVNYAVFHEIFPYLFIPIWSVLHHAGIKDFSRIVFLVS